MAKPTEGDRSRLPQWAQRKLEGLEAQIAHWKAHVDELNNAHPGTNVRLSSHIYGDTDLPPDSEVDFYLGDDRRKYTNMISVQHVRTKNREVLRISGSGQLTVLPSGGCNVIEIRTEPY